MATNANNPAKRPHLESSPAGSPSNDSENHHEHNEDITSHHAHTASVWPRFLVIESADPAKPVSSLSPFVIDKALKGIVGETKTVKKLRSGVILVELLRAAQSKNLLKQTVFASLPVRVTEHRSLNTSKGVVRNFELAQMEPSEITDNLSTQGVTAARVIKQTRNGIVRNTATVVLTFGTPVLPTEIKAGYLILKVEPFIPNPLRCFGCQAFGHHQSTCTRTKVCPKCSLTAHGEEPCTAQVKCANCSADHPAYATSCPLWIREKEICRVKTTSNISFADAKKLVLSNTQDAPLRRSYATVAKHTASAATQTDPEITQCNCTTLVLGHSSSTSQAYTTTAIQTDKQITDTSLEQQNSRKHDTSLEQQNSRKHNANAENNGKGGVARRSAAPSPSDLPKRTSLSSAAGPNVQRRKTSLSPVRHPDPSGSRNISPDLSGGGTGRVGPVSHHKVNNT
jgi:hypothetical protein